LEGENPGGLGRNTWIKQLCEEDGNKDNQSQGIQEINIGGKATVWMGKGNHLVIEISGDGSWGIDESVQHGKHDVHQLPSR